MGFNWHCLCKNYFKVTKFSWNELSIWKELSIKEGEAYFTEGWKMNFVTVI